MSPEPSHAELTVPSSEKQSRSSPSSKPMVRQLSQASSSYSQDQQTSPELLPLDDHFPASMSRNATSFSLSSPPTYSYASYPPTTDYFPSEYHLAGSYQLPHIYSESQYPLEYVQSLTPTLPTMMQSHGMKQEQFMGDDDLLTPFTMNYASLAGMDVPTTQAYAGYPARVNTTNFFPPTQYPHSR